VLRRALLVTTLVAACVWVTPAAAALISFRPDSIDTTGKITAWGAPTPEYVVTDDYDMFGVDFSYGIDTAILETPYLIWAGVNADGAPDGNSPLAARVVVPGTGGTRGATSHLTVTVQGASLAALILEAYDCAGRLVGTATNGDSFPPLGESYLTVDGEGIHSFRVSGEAGWGASALELEEPTACPALAAKSECKDDGWRGFGTFKNQGQCISSTRDP
jgi:hypothetical protein